jgi:hypothetical protein
MGRGRALRYFVEETIIIGDSDFYPPQSRARLASAKRYGGAGSASGRRRMLVRDEFGFPQRIRKSKAIRRSGGQGLDWMRARRAQRYTRVCASAESPQTAQDRRRVLRTKFEPFEI